MKLNTFYFFAVALLILASAAITDNFAAPFTPGNVVVCRVGGDATGGAGPSALTSAATQVFIDEFTPTGTYVQSIPLPTTDAGPNQTLTASGTATSECQITRSTDGKYILVTGYDAAVGTAGVASSSSTTINRVVGRISESGLVDTTTTTTGYNANNIRSAFSTDGNDIWMSGGAAPGVGYTTLGSSGAPTQISTTPTNTRFINAFGGQLYISTSSGSAVRIGTVGTGLPTTTGQTITNLPSFPTSGSPYGFFLTDLSTSVPGVDTLYVADDGTGTGATGGGIKKFSLVSGAWTYNGTVAAVTGPPAIPATTFFGLTGRKDDSTNDVTLYATRAGNQLVRITDTSGYNAFDGMRLLLPDPPVLLATAPTNTAYRSVAFAPTGPTAAEGVIAGRVLTADGFGINKVRVQLSNAGSNEVRTAITNPFGYYSFGDVEIGENYVVSVISKRYTFSNSSQFVNLLQSMEEVNFFADAETFPGGSSDKAK